MKSLGVETRRCLNCGQRQRGCNPEDTVCVWCGGKLETSLEVWK